MTLIPYGEFLPDLPAVNNPGLTVATNAVPRGQGYKGLGQLEIISDALDARCRHFRAVGNASDVYSTYAGDATKLYILASTTWSGAGTYNLTEEDLWESAQWDQKIVFTNINDEPVQATIGSGTFSTFFTSTEKPKAHHVDVVGDTMVMGDVNSTANGIVRNGVIWSALGDHADMDPSSSTNAGFQALRGNGGSVQKVIGGRTGAIFQENAIWRMTFVGPPLKFRFDHISDNIGAFSKNGTIAGADGNNIFFFAEEGFHLLHEPSGEIRSIGNNKVDDTVLAEIDKTKLHRCSVAVDPFGLFYFSYTTTGGDPDKVVIYNPHQDRWGMGEFNHQILGTYRGGAQDIDSSPLDTRDIDADPYLIDSAEFKGGEPVLAATDTANRLATFEAPFLAATLETGDAALERGGRSYVNRVRPLVEGADATVTVQLGTREILSAATVFGTETSMNGDGEVPVRGSGRYMRFRTKISGGFDDAIALEVEPRRKGRR